MRFAAQADLKVLDAVWTTASITRNHGHLVSDTLFGTDEKLQIRPQMVDKDCVQSLKRWGKTDRLGQLLILAAAAPRFCCYSLA